MHIPSAAAKTVTTMGRAAVTKSLETLLERSFADVNNRIAALSADLNGKISTLGTDISKLSADVARIETRVDATATRLEVISGRLDSLQTAVFDVHTELLNRRN